LHPDFKQPACGACLEVRARRRIKSIANGWRDCTSTRWSDGVSFHWRRFASCEISHGGGRIYSNVINRIRRLLETANIELASVMSNVVGDTGRSHPGGFSNNQAEPTGDLRRFCERLPKQKKEEIRKRCGRPPITEHFQFMLSELPDELERLDKKVDAMEVRSGRR
jgi:hypothetical protein